VGSHGLLNSVWIHLRRQFFDHRHRYLEDRSLYIYRFAFPNRRSDWTHESNIGNLRIQPWPWPLVWFASTWEFAYHNVRQEFTQSLITVFILAQFSQTSVPTPNDFASLLHEAHERLIKNCQENPRHYYDWKHTPMKLHAAIQFLNHSTRPKSRIGNNLFPLKVLERIGI